MIGVICLFGFPLLLPLQLSAFPDPETGQPGTRNGGMGKKLTPVTTPIRRLMTVKIGVSIQELFNGVVDSLRFRSYSPLLPTGKL